MRSTSAPLLALALLAAPAAATGVPVALSAPDGVKLAATYWAADRPGPGVLLLHMCNSDRSAWNGLGEKLAAAGIHALALDFRSYGESGGEAPEGFGAERQRWIDDKWPGDVDAAFGYLESRPGVDRSRMGAAGGSCGVNQAVQLARRHPEVRTLALLAGTANRAGETFLEDNDWMPLFGAAAHDDGNAVEMMEWTLALAGNPANVVRSYPDGGHGTQIFAVHDDLEPAIVEWFEEHLARHPASRPAPGEQRAERPRTPTLELWDELHEPGGGQRVLVRFTAARENDATLPLPPEAAVNLLGYELLNEDRGEDAIAVLRLNVAAHPASPNTYDSLGDIYLALGDPGRAAEMARKTLEALPDDPARDTDFDRLLREAARGKLGEPPAPSGDS